MCAKWARPFALLGYGDISWGLFSHVLFRVDDSDVTCIHRGMYQVLSLLHGTMVALKTMLSRHRNESGRLHVSRALLHTTNNFQRPYLSLKGI